MQQAGQAAAVASGGCEGGQVAPDKGAALLGDRARLRRFGVTRIGDVTGLDIIGVPVWFAVRPNSRGLSVSQGKGLTERQAQLSALMEAIEGAVAEETQRHVAAHGSWTALQARGERTVPLDRIARVNPDHFEAGCERAWIRGVSARDGGPVLAPFELVGMDFRADFPWDRKAFQMSSQGLAAGFDHDRVVLHALLELVEHDACILIDTFETRSLGLRPWAPAAGHRPSLDGLIATLSAAGLAARFLDVTASNGVPVILASLDRPVMSASGPGFRHAAGMACRFDPLAAAEAALLEAIQSRLTDISGARDDLAPDRYLPDLAGRAPQASATPSRAGPQRLDLEGEGPLWHRLAAHLFRHGVEDVYVFALETGDPDVHVVRVLAEGLSAAHGGLNRMSLSTLDGFLRR